MKTIRASDFLAFVTTLEDREITTKAGRSRFKVQVNGQGLEFSPTSTRKRRPHTKLYVDRVLDTFNKTNSFVTTDYRFTVNASYMLTLIDMYFKDSAENQ